MKSILLLSFLAMLLLSCDRSEHAGPFTACIQERIDEFKLEPSAQSIIRINRPNDPLFWFVDSQGDGVEAVVNEDCTFICITDLEGISEDYCENEIFLFPREVIWEKK